MKYIPTSELITMLQGAWPHEHVSKHSIDRMFEIYGDDYFAEGEEYKLTTENKERKQLFEKLKEHEQRESEG